MACGRPALSRNTSPSTMFGSIPEPAVARSMAGRKAATRLAVATAPPGLCTNSGRALPAAARATKSASWLER